MQAGLEFDALHFEVHGFSIDVDGVELLERGREYSPVKPLNKNRFTMPYHNPSKQTFVT